MTIDIASIPRAEWSPLPQDGCMGVDGKVLLQEEELFMVLLRFEAEATIHEHPGDTDITVVCLEGSGYTSVAGERTQIRAGERVRWPAGIPHRLWTAGQPMTTLMIERPPGTFAG